MVCRAVHFALTAEQELRLMETPGADNEFLMEFVEELEEGRDGEGWDAEWVQETDKAWDAIHRCLTDGKLEYGDTPLPQVHPRVGQPVRGQRLHHQLPRPAGSQGGRRGHQGHRPGVAAAEVRRHRRHVVSGRAVGQRL
jgi:hypothetical protein